MHISWASKPYSGSKLILLLYLKDKCHFPTSSFSRNLTSERVVVKSSCRLSSWYLLTDSGIGWLDSKTVVCWLDSTILIRRLGQKARSYKYFVSNGRTLKHPACKTSKDWNREMRRDPTRKQRQVQKIWQKLSISQVSVRFVGREWILHMPGFSTIL